MKLSLAACRGIHFGIEDAYMNASLCNKWEEALCQSDRSSLVFLVVMYLCRHMRP